MVDSGLVSGPVVNVFVSGLVSGPEVNVFDSGLVSGPGYVVKTFLFLA